MVTYLHWDATGPLPDLKPYSPSKVLVVLEAMVDPALRAEAALVLVRAGARYVCAWGDQCSDWDDDVDLASVVLDAQEEPRGLVMTSWHENSSIDDTMRFFKIDAIHPDVGGLVPVILHVSNRPKPDELRKLYEAASY